VLKAVLSRMDLQSGADGLELTRRRNITVSPRRGTPVVLRERARLRAAA
jgi:hypothetical protein